MSGKKELGPSLVKLARADQRIPPHTTATSSYFRLQTMAFASKKDDEGLSAYYNNKTTVIQEARVFNDSPISPRKCRALLTRVVHLLYIGESFSAQEATTLFFGTTKLFQHKDVCSFMLCLTNRPDHTDAANAERAATDGLLSYQGACGHGRGCYHGHKQYHKRHAIKFRGHLSAKFVPCLMSDNRRVFTISWI